SRPLLPRAAPLLARPVLRGALALRGGSTARFGRRPPRRRLFLRRARHALHPLPLRRDPRTAPLAGDRARVRRGGRSAPTLPPPARGGSPLRARLGARLCALALRDARRAASEDAATPDALASGSFD